MNTNTILTQIQIGYRLSELRKMKGMTQEDLASQIDVSRPTLVQIEQGNRNVNVPELQKLSLVLGFSLDEFVSKVFVVDHPENTTKESPKKDRLRKQKSVKEKSVNEIDERISSPRIQIKKFKNVLLYILEKCAGKPNVGETVLYKLLYFSDFNYYELYEEHLTGAMYRKLPYGPVPHGIDSVLQSMIAEGQLKKVKTEFHSYPQVRYLPLAKSDLTSILASEKEVLDKVIDQMGDWSASAISGYSHKDMPWLATKEGKSINYELVFYREPPFSVRNYGEQNEVQ
ncbi:MAG: DUF4065 domain-containing protein [Ignavibacteria bacterium]|nr:DUF4065 domain-containing protein [Ignavibacteria bacterium]